MIKIFQIIVGNRNNTIDSEIVLSKENDMGSEAAFFDLHIHIFEPIHILNLYDKPDDFSCTVVQMPRASSTIASSAFYFSIAAKGLKNLRETWEGSSFYTCCHTVVQRTIKQGAKKPKTCKDLTKLLNRYLYEFQHITSDTKFTITQFYMITYTLFFYIFGMC